MNKKQEKQEQAVLSVAHHDFHNKLDAHAFFRVNDHELSEDLVQDTFLKTWNYLRRNGKITMMKAFLYHVLNNLIVDAYRKHKTISLDTLLESGYEPSTDSHLRLIDTLDGKTASTLIARLVEKYQTVLRMRYEEHLTLSEMSRLTGQTKNTLAVRIHRGLKQLKVLYDNPHSILGKAVRI